jgi:hypothetical protein
MGNRWEGNNEINIKEIGFNSSGSGQRPLAHSHEHGNKTPGSIKDGRFLIGCATISVSKKFCSIYLLKCVVLWIRLFTQVFVYSLNC